MATIKFREYSDIQVIIEISHMLGKDEMILTLSGNHIQVSITEDEEDKADFILYHEEAQRMFDWLKTKGVVK